MKISFIITLILFSARPALSQISIEGPDCVTPGIEYTYKIVGPLRDSSAVQLCITNGVFGEQKTSCIKTYLNSIIKVVWNQDAERGSLSLEGRSRSNNLTVSFAKPLEGGEISNERKQTIKFDAVPGRVIQCTPASGGGCDARYVYQWQISEDNVNWKDLAGANEQHLTVRSKLHSSFYYRRKVTDMNSRDYAYSTYSTVFVEPEEKK